MIGGVSHYIPGSRSAVIRELNAILNIIPTAGQRIMFVGVPHHKLSTSVPDRVDRDLKHVIGRDGHLDQAHT